MEKEPLITRDKSLLVVIDMQERLVPAMAEPAKIVENTKRLLALAKIMDLPVIFTEQEKLGKTVEELSKEYPSPDPVSKIAFNCFLSEAFASRVENTHRRTLIITGIEAHICVAQTALSAYPRFEVHVAADAISSRAPLNLHLALERMRAWGVTITSTEMVIYELLRKAGTDEFRAMLPLIK